MAIGCPDCGGKWSDPNPNCPNSMHPRALDVGDPSNEERRRGLADRLEAKAINLPSMPHIASLLREASDALRQASEPEARVEMLRRADRDFAAAVRQRPKQPIVAAHLEGRAEGYREAASALAPTTTEQASGPRTAPTQPSEPEARG